MNAFAGLDVRLFAIAIPLMVLYAAWALCGRFEVSSMRHVFLIVAGYFALCVPVDLLIGLELRGGREFLADLNDELFRPDILRGLLLYTECLVCFLAAYALSPNSKSPQREIRSLGIHAPPLWIAMTINIACLLFYLYVFGNFARIDRMELARQSASYKLMTLSVTFTFAFNFLYLLKTEQKNNARWIVAFAVFFSFLTGGRIWAAAMVLFYIFRFRISLGRLQVIGVATVFVVASLIWKEASAHFWETGRFLIYADPENLYGLSRFEGIQSWVMTVEILHDQAPPYWMGWSYIVLPAELLWPRFLVEFPPQTLSETYGEFLRPTFFDSGGGIGFSAIGEAWLNFGFIGPGLLGLTWGLAAKWIDQRPKGLMLIGFFIMTLRLFRSDFGSLFKSWIVIFGVALVLVVIVWQCLELIGQRYAALSRPFPSARVN